MNFYRYFKIIMLFGVICLGYISTVNYTNHIKHNTKISSNDLAKQQKKIITLQGEISSALAANAHKYRMVKIPISKNSSDSLNK